MLEQRARGERHDARHGHEREIGPVDEQERAEEERVHARAGPEDVGRQDHAEGQRPGEHERGDGVGAVPRAVRPGEQPHARDDEERRPAGAQPGGEAQAVGQGAGGAALLVAAGVGLLARSDRARDRADSITALVLAGALALGVILASDVFGSRASVDALLFGSLLLIDGADLALMGAASVMAVAAGAVLEHRWVLTGFDPAAAPALGVRSAWADGALLAVIALASVAALSAVGALLATALLVLPAATTRLVCTRIRSWQLATVALVLAEGVAGVWLSVRTDAPPGATIAVLAGGVFAVTAAGRALAPRLRGRRRGPAPAAAGLAGGV